MGMNFVCSSGRAVAQTPAPNDPIPSRFRIQHLEQYGNFVIGKVIYPNCTTFDGLKIIVWENVTVDDIYRMDVIDPHFFEDNKIIARFAPTKNGMHYAIQFVKQISQL